VRTGKVECETLVIDSLTTVYNALLNAAVSARLKDGKEDLRPIDWGRIKRKFSQMLDELYHKLPVNVVCVGWIKPEYAKPGSRWNGKTISENDLVKIGEQFDGDRKASYAFDFVFKILDNDGKRTRAEVIKTRSGKLKTGQVIEDFSYKTLAALMPGGVVAPQGMTDDEASDKDVGDAVVDPPAKVHRDVEDNEANRGKAIQMIHIEAQKVGLDTKDKDPTTPYRKMLADYFHVDSSKDLALPQLQELYRMVRQYGREHVHA
jgi:hypothetical protein